MRSRPTISGVSASLLLSSALFAVQGSPEPPEELIRKLYQAHQPWAGKEVDLDHQSGLAPYFDEELIRLLLADSECKSKSGEICNLDFDPILDAQDYEEGYKRLRLKRIRNEPEVSVEVVFENLGPRRLVYRARLTKAGWRIYDIEYSSGLSLKALLSSREGQR